MLAIALVVAICSICSSPRAQPEDLDSLYQRVLELYHSGDSSTALPLAQRFAEVVKSQYGEHSEAYAFAANILALLYKAQGRYTDAEPLQKRALVIMEKVLGSEHPLVGTSLNNLAALYDVQGRYTEAEPLHKRAIVIREKVLGSEHPDVAQSLGNLAALYHNLGRYTDAEPLHRRALVIREKALGAEHPDVATSLNNLATLYNAQGRYTEAEPLHKRAIVIREKALGSEHPDFATSLNNLAGLYEALGRYTDAEPLYQRALVIWEKALGSEHPNVAASLNNLASLYQAQGRYADAVPHYKRALVINEKAYGSEHPNVATNLNNLAGLYSAQGRYAEAEPHHKRALVIREKSLGPEHPQVALSLNNLAQLYNQQGRDTEAEPLLKRALVIMEKALGSEHPEVATGLQNLAWLYQTRGRYTEAEPLFKRSLVVYEKALGSEHPNVAEGLNNLAWLYDEQGRYTDAEPLYKRALAIREKAFSAEHPAVARSLHNLAWLYYVQDRYADAEPLFRRALVILEMAVGSEHPNFAHGLNNLALLYDEQGRYTDAQPLFKRALATREKALGPEHPLVAQSLTNLAINDLLREDWASALLKFRRATQLLIARDKLAGNIFGEALVGEKRASGVSVRHSIWGLIKVLGRLAKESAEQPAEMENEAFVSTQLAHVSGATKALSQMAARFGVGDTRLSGVVRERQDLVSQWQTTDKRLTAALSFESNKRSANVEAALRTRLAQIDERIGAIDETLRAEFPDYAQLASPEPLTIEETQALLSNHEALLLFLETPEINKLPAETFIWAVTKKDIRRVRIPIGRETLFAKVQTLRNGFGVGRTRGAFVTGEQTFVALDVAHDLYVQLLGPISDVIEGKQLIIVPSSTLTSLPWNLLISKHPEANSNTTEVHADTAWLVRDHAITVLPSVSSLAALRRNANVSAARRPFIGIGNPLLAGPDGADSRAAKFADCSDWISAMQVADPSDSVNIRSLFRGTGADVERVRLLEPLPETTNELCRVAQSLGAPESEILLGANATEKRVKAMSGASRLDEYRIVHFATHGLVAGDLDGLVEPALVLTPPDEASAEDDGLLTASEVTQLRLDADWVVLSACDTAAGDGGNAEALSGLARAFFYAGARALLVSHWKVNSQAAVELTTKVFAELKADPEIGRAEALRRAMLALIDSVDPTRAHPAYWAPFVVVGESETAPVN